MVEIKDSQMSAGIIELEKTFQEYKKKLENAEQEAQWQVPALWREEPSPGKILQWLWCTPARRQGWERPEWKSQASRGYCQPD